MGDDDFHPTRRNVLKAAGTSSVLAGSTALGSGLGAADHRASNCTREPGLQGQVPAEEQIPGRTEPYCRNMRLVGQNTIEDRGANFQLNWYGDYAYVGQAHLGALAENANRNDLITDDPLWGTAVIDASDPQKPEMSTVIQSPAHFNTWEALSVSEKRDLLVCSGNTSYLDIHDLSNPAEPELLSSVELPLHSHGLILSPDGKTAYVNSTGDGGTSLVAYDISDPTHPEQIATHSNGAHDVNISFDGTRLYMADTGVVVMDVSEVEHRKFNPEIRRMGQTQTSDITHAGEVFRKHGREYFVTQDEVDGDGGSGGIKGGCPWGFARITDVTDGWAPREVSQFKLQVNKYTNCHLTQKDAGPNPGLLSGLSFYSAHYNGLDRESNPNVSFFTWYGAGLRVVDIRDLANPSEIAYYNPPPNPNTKFQQYNIWSQTTQFADGTPSYVRYRPESGHIWVLSVQNGFQILELTGDAGDIPR